ncbi:MotE family protein [Bacillus sp. 31A1R]|uniref:MotE family protein n=1 Tax=Robertmurraya mangrovi TaxID=3098077 RepID=A0ABU5J240_9BACI|nr:MotE family protein [Bacillus sp. 31A1R]MDZ5473480.1 MotE family protein [Bacillus sp. 31A1R]
MANVIEEQEQTEKKFNKFQWFLFVVLIPLLFAITLGLIVATVAGINVFETSKEYGQKLPFVSSLFKEEEVKSVEEFEKNIISLEAQIKDREAKIEQLELEIDGKVKEVERGKLEKEQLQIQIDELLSIQEENKRAFKDIVKTYETMSAKKAAPIIAEMTDKEALKILSNLKADTLASVLENMDAAKAAKYTEKLTNEE